jgi:tetratricopeptide (TPR) repeat protein
MKDSVMRRVASWGVGLALWPLLAGCGARVATSGDVSVTSSDKPVATAPVEPPPDPNDPDIARLTPLPNLDGILVCEPVADGADAATSDFGAGVARWLHLVVGGQPQLGRQVAWVGPERVRTEMGRADLRLSKDDAARAAKMVGVRVVAVGTVSGTPDAAVLRYQLYNAPAMTARGKELTARGSIDEVAAALPGLASSMAHTLGVTGDLTLPASKPRAADLSAVARFPWQCKAALTEAQLTEIEALSKRLPVAGIAAFESVTWQDGDETEALAKRLLAQAPGNVLVLSEIGRRASDQLQPAAASVKSLIARYPKNYLLTRLKPRVTAAATWADAAATARTAVRLSPDNPDAWGALSDALSNEADSVRNAQVWASMTPAEGARVQNLYPQAVAAAIRAVRIDPLYAGQWSGLASAASFNSDETTAERALVTALKLQPVNYAANWWALQMYQPKWFDDPAKLAAAAKFTARQKFDSPSEAVGLSLTMKGLGFAAESDTLRLDGLGRLEAAVKRKPDSYFRRGLWISALRKTGDVTQAVAQAKENVRRHPDLSEARSDLGELYMQVGDLKSAETTFRALLADKPAYKWANVKLGMCLVSNNRWKDGEAELRKGVPAFPRYAPGHLALGYALQRQSKWTEAEKELTAATSLEPTNGEAWDNLTRVLNALGRYPDALAAAERGAVYNQRRPSFLAGAGEALYGTGRYRESAAAYEEYIKNFPQDPGVYMLYARALQKLGRGAEADKAARECIRLAPTSPAAAIARKLLTSP